MFANVRSEKVDSPNRTSGDRLSERAGRKPRDSRRNDRCRRNPILRVSRGENSRLLDPPAALARPIAAVDPVPAREQLPSEARALERGAVEQVEATIVGQRRLAPTAVGD